MNWDKTSRVNYYADLYINVTYSIYRLTRRVQQQCHTEDGSHRTLSTSVVRCYNWHTYNESDFQQKIYSFAIVGRNGLEARVSVKCTLYAGS